MTRCAFACILLHSGLATKAKDQTATPHEMSEVWRYANTLTHWHSREVASLEGHGKDADAFTRQIVEKGRILLAARNATHDVAAEEQLALQQSPGKSPGKSAQESDEAPPLLFVRTKSGRGIKRIGSSEEVVSLPPLSSIALQRESSNSSPSSQPTGSVSPTGSRMARTTRPMSQRSV